MAGRRTKAGGAKKRPTRYAGAAPGQTAIDLGAALRAHRKGHWAEAMQGYRARLERVPGCLDSCMNLAALDVLSGRAREAAALYERATTVAPRDPRVHRDAAIGLASVGQTVAARRAFERSVALDDRMVGAYLGLSRVCAELGDREAAADHARGAVERAPLDASAHLELHRALFDDRDLGPCLEPARKAVALDPSYALARLFLSGALRLAGRHAEASAALGEPGLVAPGLVDAVAFALGEREPGTRHFATKRETLEHAIGRCTLPGPAMEFGVRHGVSTRIIAQRLEGELHGFDSFQGLPESWQRRDPGAFSTDGELPDVPPNVTLHVGRFEATLPTVASTLQVAPRLIHIDSDLCSSARTVLQTLGPWMVPGCVVVFDELIGNASWRDDEFHAFCEATETFGWKHTPLSLSWVTGQAAFVLNSRRRALT